MATPRPSTPRGTQVRGESGTPAGRRRSRRSGPGDPDATAPAAGSGTDGLLPAGQPLAPGTRGPVADPTAPRQVVDYALQRRAALQRLRGPAALTSDHCDAHPYLLRAARHHGEPAGRPCPVCRRTDLDLLTYVYGDDLGPYSGRLRATADLPDLARGHGELQVHVVEVCQGCGWNHLTMSYVVGDGVPRRPPPRPRDLLD